MNDGNEFKTTYKILNNVLTGDTLQLQYVSCEFEVFNVVHNKENAALNVNVKNGDAYWLSTSGGTIDGNVIINGDLNVINLSSTTISTQTVLIEDTFLVLNNGEIGSGISEGSSGLLIDRGLLNDAYLYFDESDDLWHHGISGGTDYILPNENYVNKSGDTMTGDLTVEGDINYTKSSAQISSLIGFSSTLTSSETYYTLVNSDLSGETLHNFVYSGSTGEIIFTGTQPERILFAGSADIEIDSVAATLTFVLFINGNIIERGKTPSDFTSLDRLKNISINRILELEYGDKVTVQVKSSVAGVDLTVSTINLSLWG